MKISYTGNIRLANIEPAGSPVSYRYPGYEFEQNIGFVADELADMKISEAESKLSNAASLFETYAKATAPVKTGQLRDSIYGRVQRQGRKRLKVTAAVPVYYAIYVEFGTIKWSGRPFFRRSFMYAFSSVFGRGFAEGLVQFMTSTYMHNRVIHGGPSLHYDW